MDHSRFPRYMLSYEPTGKGSLGRPRKRWISQIWEAATDESPMHEVEEEEGPPLALSQSFIFLLVMLRNAQKWRHDNSGKEEYQKVELYLPNI
jgi:hypothetical protein